MDELHARQPKAGLAGRAHEAKVLAAVLAGLLASYKIGYRNVQ